MERSGHENRMSGSGAGAGLEKNTVEREQSGRWRERGSGERGLSY